MIDVVKKWDGSEAAFDYAKISNALLAAGKATGEFKEGRAGRLTNKVLSVLETRYGDAEVPTVEDIQDTVEDVLLASAFARTAKAYILYRDNRSDVRNLDKGLDLIDTYVEENDWRLKENASMSFSLNGLNNYLSAEISSRYWLKKVYTPDIHDAHISGAMHIHDLSLIAPYCVGWDLMDLLITGFGGVRNKVVAGPPKHFGSALGQMFNFLYTLQGEAAGAQAFSNVDTLLAPFVWVDDLTYEEVKQEIQQFIYNLNVPTRVGFMQPFTNLTFDLVVSPNYADQAVIIGGKAVDRTYDEFQKEMDMINRAFAEVMFEGDYSGQPFSFPIPTYNITPDFDWSNPEYEPIWKMAGKYGIPYFANFVNSDMKPEDVRSMCPIAGGTRVLLKTELRGVSIFDIQQAYRNQQQGTQYKIFSKGYWYDATITRQQTDRLVEVRLGNGEFVKLGEEHKQLVKFAKGAKMEIVRANDICPQMYVPFNRELCDAGFDDEMAGFVVGAFIGDGSYAGDSRLTYSLNYDPKKTAAFKKIRKFFQQMGFVVDDRPGKRNVRFVHVKSHKGAAAAWMRQFLSGNSALTKRLEFRSFSFGSNFLRGLLDGWYQTDGGNRGRIYTANIGLCDDFATICGLLGEAYTIDRVGDTREGRYGTKPVYTCKFHKRDCYGSAYFLEDDYWWIPVTDVSHRYDEDCFVYCLDIASPEKLFQLANGLITFGCGNEQDDAKILSRLLRPKRSGLFSDVMDFF